MKILHLTNHVLEIGNGIVNVAVDLAHGQVGVGHEVHFASSGGEYEPLLSRSGVVHHRIATPGASMSGVAAILKFAVLVRRIKPDIVHAHMVKWAAIARLLSPLFGYKVVSTVHNVYQRSSKVMGYSHGVVALGEASRGIIQEWGTPPERIHVVVNAPLGSPRGPGVDEVVPFAMASPSIVSVGGMFVRKGFAPLIEAFPIVRKVHPGATLHLVGEGPDRAEFEDLASRVAPQGVTFHGFQANPRPFLKGADVTVLASFRESFPLVLLEAREFGVRIVATDVDGNREALDGGRAGWLAKAGDHESIAKAILDALASEPPEAVGEGLDRYRLPSLVRSTDRIYEAVLKA